MDTDTNYLRLYFVLLDCFGSLFIYNNELYKEIDSRSLNDILFPGRYNSTKKHTEGSGLLSASPQEMTTLRGAQSNSGSHYYAVYMYNTDRITRT